MKPDNSNKPNDPDYDCDEHGPLDSLKPIGEILERIFSRPEPIQRWSE